MRFISFFIFGALLVVLLTACNREEMWDAKAPQKEVSFATNFLHELSERDFDAVQAKLGSRMQTWMPEPKLNELVDQFLSSEQINWSFVLVSSGNVGPNLQTNLVLEHESTDGWVIATISLMETQGQTEVVDLKLTKQESSLKEANSLSLSNRSLTHYTIAGAGVLLSLFQLSTFMVCLIRRRWGWALLTLIAIGKLLLNWTTGQFGYNLLSISFGPFCLGAVNYGPYSAWIVSISLPIFAILFWFSPNRKAVASETPGFECQGCNRFSPVYPDEPRVCAHCGSAPVEEP